MNGATTHADHDPAEAVPERTVQPAAGAAPLLGQADALAVLRAGLNTRGPAFLEVVGDPGMGKSRLLVEFGRLARESVHRVVTGTGAQPAADDRPGLFVPLLRQLGDPAPTLRYRRIVDRLVAGERWALVLDDVHLADQESLELLGQLCYEAPPMLLVIAYRGRQLPSLLAAAIRLIRSDGWHHRLELDPLSEPDVATLVGLRPGPRLRRLYAACAGNPQYAQALAAMDPGLVHEAQPELLELAEMPSGLLRELRAELAQLPADERRLLAAAAVAGDDVVPSLAVAGAELDRRAAGDALDALIRRDLLRDGRSGLTFRHPVVRAAVYHDTPPGVRRALHAQLAAELRERGAAEPALARHLGRSADQGEVAAAELLVSSVRDAAPRLAADRLTAARALLPPDAGYDGFRFELDVRLAEAWTAAGRLALAREILRAPAPPTAPARWRYRQMRVSARVDRLRGLHREALGLVGAELDRVPDETGREIAALAVEAAICAAFCGAPDAPAYVTRARRAAAGVPDAGLHALVAAVAVFVGARYGGVPGLRGEVAAAGYAADALRDTELVEYLDAAPLLGWAELMLERDADALRHFDRGLAVAARSGRSDALPYLLLGRCSASSRLGLLEAASDAALDSADAASALGNRPMLGFALTFQAVVLCWLRGPVAAGPVADEAAEVVDAAPQSDWFAQVGQRVSARLRHTAGDLADPTATLVRACGGPDMPVVELYNRTYWCSVLVEMAVRAGDLTEAAHWLDRGTAHAAGLGLTGSEAYLALSRARYELAAGRPAAAEAPADQAVRGFADVGWIVDEVTARLFSAALRAELSGWSAAEPELVEARRLAERTGGGWLRRAVVAEQRRLAGAAGRGTPGSRLTRRETEIARLVAAGATNGEIAAHLHVTVKTIEAHLTRMFRKLGVRSRAALVAALADD